MATHYRAGEITYRQLSLNTYEITVITYTDPKNTAADNPQVDVYFGDNTVQTVQRNNGNGEIVNADPNNWIKKNIYQTTHTYPGPGNYIINTTNPNRIDGIRNINNGNSVQIAFYVESYLKIAEGYGFNQSPVLLLPPIDIGCLFQVFKHNPSAYDPDGDSLAFTLISPKMAVGQVVPNWTVPLFSDSFSLGVNNGMVTWTTPQVGGPYNIAIRISEFRKGVLIGYVVRDMQIYIHDNCNNHPPKIEQQADTCVEAGQLINRTIRASDIDVGQTITLRKYGGPFVQVLSPATVNPDPAIGLSPVATQFSWRPSCNAIRYRTFSADFRATDNSPTDPLSDIMHWNIKVVGPAPRNVTVQQDSNGLRINWTPDSCNLGYGYRIYRRIDSSHWSHAACEIGVPAYTGYQLYDTTQGVNNASFFDNQFGRGISPLIRYCYLVTTWYPPRSENGTIIYSDAVEGYASKEVCGIIIRTNPIITKASVLSTSQDHGQIQVDWLSPNAIDTTQIKPPYEMQLWHKVTGGSTYSATGAVFSFPTFAALTDMSVIDSLLNTERKQYEYKVTFNYFNNKGNAQTLESVAATSVYNSLYNTDKSIVLNWNATVPWQNKNTVIYRKNAANSFDSIGSTTFNYFKDTGLVNGQSYCYKVQTKGFYNSIYFAPAILNLSEEMCGVPVDTIPPCNPSFSIDTPCNPIFFSNFVKLSWTYPANCTQDVVKYRVYWKQRVKDKWLKILDTSNLAFHFTDTRDLLKFSIAGCYAVTAVDSAGNESSLLNSMCIDNCPQYILPNIFTPNGDGNNDLFIPFPYRFVDKIDLTIYNRWGQVVFTSQNPDILWNGKDQKSGIDCTDGVYYYICNVTENYLEGYRTRNMRGTVQLIR